MDTARAIATQFFGAAPDTLEVIEGLGSVNRMFLARQGAQTIIVRLPKAEDRERAEAFYEKEDWCLKAAGFYSHIPGPEVLDLGVYEGWPYQIQSFIEGINGEHSGVEPGRIYCMLGTYARDMEHIHFRIQLNGFGETLPDFLASDGIERWQRFIAYNRESLTPTDPLLSLGVYLPSQRNAILARFNALAEQEVELGLCHGDLAPRNTILGTDRTLFLIDWGCAEVHVVPHYNLLYIPLEFREDFMDGYGWNEEHKAELYAEVDNLALLKAFDLVRWAIDRCPERITELAEKARILAQAVA
ncbi:MAG: aminoglycoside phosphotransferase family protein [Armatimonas sp.]